MGGGFTYLVVMEGEDDESSTVLFENRFILLTLLKRRSADYYLFLGWRVVDLQVLNPSGDLFELRSVIKKTQMA